MAGPVATGIVLIAPWYNILLTLIAFYFLWRLFSLGEWKRDVFIKPWYFVAAALGIFVLEQVFTILKVYQWVSDAIIPRWFNAIFELIVVVLFIYMLFLQINHVKKKYKKK